MKKEQKAITPESFREMVMAFQTSRILLSAYELGLFTALGDEGKDSASVAKILGTDGRATDRLMNALCAMGFLMKKKGIFTNGEFSAKHLVKGKPGYMAGLMHSVNVWETWHTLTAAVRKGKSIKEDHVDDRGDQWLEGFISAMHERARHQSDAVAGLIDHPGVKRILDVGGGSGAYSMGFLRKWSGRPGGDI